MHPVELLAVVLVRLHIGILSTRHIEVRRARRVVVRHLQDIAAAIHHLADIAQVVLVVVVEREAIVAAARWRSFRIASIKEVSVYPAVLHHQLSVHEVIC